jgi:hypothetical protein
MVLLVLAKADAGSSLLCVQILKRQRLRVFLNFDIVRLYSLCNYFRNQTPLK